MNHEQKITVMIVDDHAIVRGGIRSFLETQEDLLIIGEAGSGSEGVHLAETIQPDVILMDLVMEDPTGGMDQIDGVEATYRIRKVSPHSNVIILTSFHDDTYIFPAIQAGALSYVLKTIAPEKLADAIRAAARGEAIIDPKVASRVMQKMRGEDDNVLDPFALLTERELEVLRLIATGCTNAMIAEQLVITERTVKSHVSSILSKLQLRDRTQAAIFAWQNGVVHAK